MTSAANQESPDQANDKQQPCESQDVQAESTPEQPSTVHKSQTQIITSGENEVLKLEIPAPNSGIQENLDAKAEDNPLNYPLQKLEDLSNNTKDFDEIHMNGGNEKLPVSNMVGSSDVEEATKSSQIRGSHGPNTDSSPSESRRRGETIGSSSDSRLPIPARRQSETSKTSRQSTPTTSRRDSQSRLAAEKAVANSHSSGEIERELVKKIQDLKDQVQQLRSERDQAKRDKGQAETEKERVKTVKERLKKERDAVIAERDIARSDKKNLRLEKEKLELERSQAISDRKRANVEREKAKREREAAINQKSQLSTERDRLKVEIEKLKSERDDAIIARDKAEAERNQLKVDSERRKSKRTDAKAGEIKLRESRDNTLPAMKALENEKNLAISERDQARIEIADAKAAKEKAESERDEARAEGEQHLLNFTDIQNQIFSMQPRRPDIMEEEAIDAYSSLCMNVADWIDSHLDDALEREYEIFSQTGIDIDSGYRLLRLIRMTPGAIKAREVPNTLQYYLQMAVMNFLHHEIFHPEPFGTDGGPWMLLHVIESNMRALDPHRDEAAIRAWRSETLLALHTSVEYINARHHLVNNLTVFLFHCLQVLLPEISEEDRESLLKSIAQMIIIPAVDLSEKFHISAKVFGFFRHGFPDGHPKIAQEVESFEFKDLHDSGRAVRQFQDGFDYHYITDISLGLYTRTIKGDMISTKKYLKKAQVLLAVIKPDKSYEMKKNTALGHIYRCVENYRAAHAEEIAKDIKPKSGGSIFKSFFEK